MDDYRKAPSSLGFKVMIISVRTDQHGLGMKITSMGHMRGLLSLASLLLVCGGAVHACEILQLSDAGLAANVNSLWFSLPSYHGLNGSIFVDNAKFAYKCTEYGGWHDIFVPESGPAI
jgi:hypothetical protein